MYYGYDGREYEDPEMDNMRRDRQEHIQELFNRWLALEASSEKETDASYEERVTIENDLHDDYDLRIGYNQETQQFELRPIPGKDYSFPLEEIMQFAPNGVPDRSLAMIKLKQEFIAWLLFSGNKTPDEVVQAFVEHYAGVLSWLGIDRQDAILQAGMEETGVDLSSWLEKE